ncbi:MAG: hypothetical protein H7249_08315 [Chitinophagaceae bacterium]|nr:hypothetical protein [Oligoflexus sp.]
MKNIWIPAVLMPLAFGLPLSCSQVKSDSFTKEAPDSPNVVETFGLSAMPTYDQIVGVKKAFTKNMPWSDTYWPYTAQGLARRWAYFTRPSGLVNLSQFWQDQLDNTQGRSVSPYLSPAEKYDLMFRLRYGKDVDTHKLKSEIKDLASKERAIKHAGDRDAKRQAIGDLQTAFDSSNTIQNWSPMASAGWDTFLDYTKNPSFKFFNEADSGADWSWMGICHGWSPAALMHETPKHSVMVKLDGKEILVTEGDVRGLLSKSWADHSPDDNQYFLGRRCNENVDKPDGDIPHGLDGRGVTGMFILNGNSQTFTMVDEFLPGAAFSGRRIYEISLGDDTATIYLIEKAEGSKSSYFLSSDLGQVRSYVESGDTSAFTPLSGTKFYGCWDVNPASFHTILTEHLGKTGQSFVMDRTRTGQVWNQPVYGANMDVGPLLDAATVNDHQFRHRAAGTTYLAQVKTSVFWSSEPSEPAMSYGNDFDRSQLARSDYQYTLEFDADKRLIGGEWGTFEPNRADMVIPDFLYSFKAGSRPVDDIKGGFDYSGIIDPIYKCSIAAGPTKSTRVGGSVLDYVDCDLTKANP